jgi:hypothetical protein
VDTSNPTSRNQAPPNRPVWLAIIVLASLIIAAGAGFALDLAHASPATAVGGAGAAFTAAMTLGMAAWKFLAG